MSLTAEYNNNNINNNDNYDVNKNHNNKNRPEWIGLNADVLIHSKACS